MAGHRKIIIISTAKTKATRSYGTLPGWRCCSAGLLKQGVFGSPQKQSLRIRGLVVYLGSGSRRPWRNVRIGEGRGNASRGCAQGQVLLWAPGAASHRGPLGVGSEHMTPSYTNECLPLKETSCLFILFHHVILSHSCLRQGERTGIK